MPASHRGSFRFSASEVWHKKAIIKTIVRMMADLYNFLQIFNVTFRIDSYGLLVYAWTGRILPAWQLLIFFAVFRFFL
jgi:hypothetical protein